MNEQITTSTYTRGRDKFAKVAWALNLLIAFYRLFPMNIRIKLFEHYRWMQGLKGLGVRYALLKAIAKNCGDNVSIHPDVYLLNPQNLSLGDNVSIHPMCYIECGKISEGVIIGNDVSIAHGCTIMASKHTFNDEKQMIKDQPVEYKSVTIHNDVWLGAKSTILAGLNIHEGAIVAAGAVVTKDVDERTIVAGVPARELKKR